jgi:hypothetical protein
LGDDPALKLFTNNLCYVMVNKMLVKEMAEAIMLHKGKLSALETQAKKLFLFKKEKLYKLTELSGPAWKRNFLSRMQTIDSVVITGPSCSGKSFLCYGMSDPRKVRKPRVMIDADASQSVAWIRRLGPVFSWDKFVKDCAADPGYVKEFDDIAEALVLADYGRCVIDMHYTPKLSSYCAQSVITLVVVFVDLEGFIFNCIERGMSPSEMGWRVMDAWSYYLKIMDHTRKVSQENTFWLSRTPNGYQLLDPLVAYEQLTFWASDGTIQTLADGDFVIERKNILDEIDVDSEVKEASDGQ